MPASQSLTVVERYSATAQLFHWLTALLVVVAYIVSVGGSETRVYSPANDFSRGLHELLGMSVFALTLARVGWRAIFPPPKCPDMPAWMALGGRLGHWGIYALLVLLPVTAILGAWLEGHPLTLLAVGNIQPWLPSSRQLGLVLADIHGWLGNVLIWLAGAHAAAALYHHFWRRDTVLTSMLPGR
jgi:cytochrome b561